MSSYNYLTGVEDKSLLSRFFCKAITTLAVIGWLVLLVIFITIFTNTFDELILILWEI